MASISRGHSLDIAGLFTVTMLEILWGQMYALAMIVILLWGGGGGGGGG